MKRLFLLLAIIFCVSYSAGQCFADDYGPESLQCDSGLVAIGAAKSEVQSSCGQPVNKSTISDGSEIWTYNFGPTDFVYTFTFVNGQLDTIKQGDRGY